MRPEGALSHKVDPFLEFLHLRFNFEENTKNNTTLSENVKFALDLSQGGIKDCYRGAGISKIEYMLIPCELACNLFFRKEIEKNRELYNIILDTKEIRVPIEYWSELDKFEYVQYKTQTFCERLLWSKYCSPVFDKKKFGSTTCHSALAWLRRLQLEVTNSGIKPLWYMR